MYKYNNYINFANNIQIYYFNNKYLQTKNIYYLHDGGAKRDMAYDDKMRLSKKGIYRKSYKDSNNKVTFKYFYMHNDKQVSNTDLERINALGLAPAYTDVWVSLDPTSKIQAIGFDEKHRKQYRYHPEHIQTAQENKFLRLYKFIKAVPKLNKAIDTDKNKPMYSKNRTIALMLMLIQELNIRVGKECYAQHNNSYGITSLKKTHITFGDGLVKFNFKGKSNKNVSYTIRNTEYIKELEKLKELPGEKIFQYITDKDLILRVTDVDINKYIQEYMGKSFTCKDFRTYAANFYFVKALLKETKARSPITNKIIKENLNYAQENTAFYLRHTKAVSKKSYTMALIRENYISNPTWFIEHKNSDPVKVLLDILSIYKKTIIESRSKKKNKLFKDEEESED